MTSPQQGFATLTAPGTTPKINSIFDFSAEALAQFKLWLEGSGFAVPISQILGFTQFSPALTTVATSQNTTSTSYTDLTTVGPQVASLGDGKYLLLYGCQIKNVGGALTGWMSPKINSTEAVDGDAATLTSLASSPSQTVYAALKTLNNAGNNTVTMRYKTDAGTAAFSNRWLLIVKYANL